MIHSYTTGKSKFPLKYFCCIVLWHTCLVPEYMKNSKWLSLFAVCYLKVRKERCLQNFCSTEKWMMLDIVVKNILKIIAVSNNLVFICRFYNHNLVFIHYLWLVKYAFSTKKWFVKTSCRIMKYKSRVVKMNPGKSDFYELWQQHKQLKTIEMSEAWSDTFNEGFIHQFQPEATQKIP